VVATLEIDYLPAPNYVCDPATGGTMACPCANPPAGSRRGCENSSGSGGAVLAAHGVPITFLLNGPAPLYFTAGGEPPNVTSVLLQGNAPLAAGAVFGQGVRCVAGAMKRLYVKSADATGAVVVPNIPPDPLIQTRSLVLGDHILPGQTRWYLIYYRDANVLGGCPSTATFNATNTAEVLWY
jgi:hypothetical protein